MISHSSRRRFLKLHDVKKRSDTSNYGSAPPSSYYIRFDRLGKVQLVYELLTALTINSERIIPITTTSLR
jgi:hypothetical protein